MSVLEKAELQEITSDQKADPIGDPVPVQFNPTTLKLKLSNQTEGGRSRGRQARQYTGSSSTVLTVELVFDTADEGTTGNPRSVRERTAIVERYVLPREDGKEAPPKLRFQWGSFAIVGIVDSVDIDFDHFAPNGAPLRAKVSLSLKEQDAKYQFLKSGPGANRQTGDRDSGETSGSGPGSAAARANRSAPALAGETAPEFAARVGLDPAAWRSLDVDLSGGLALKAGVEVGFNAELNVSGGLGVRAGVHAGVDASLEASVGLKVDSALSGTGFALASAGGLDAALQTVQTARSEQAQSSARAAFPPPAADLPPATARSGGPPSSPPPAPSRVPLTLSGLPSPSQQAQAPPAAPPPRVDPRTVTFGLGVPLRTSITGAAIGRSSIVVGREIAPTPATPGFRINPTTPPWEELPLRDPGRRAADETQVVRRPVNPCACGNGE